MLEVGRKRLRVLDVDIDVVSTQQALTRISAWAQARESRYVCICNAHSVVTASNHPAFHRAVMLSDLATPDGAPVAFMLRRLGAAAQHRVSGPDLMWDYCALAAERGESLFLLGSTERTLALLRQRLIARWPDLQVAGALSPPFRPLSAAENSRIVDTINASGASTVWVSFGCPKQELWMADQAGQIRAPMIGVGAAFDFHAGTVKRAPPWMQRSGLEWLHRMGSEPRRLWRRYLFTNTQFIQGALRQWFSRRGSP